MRIRYFTCYSIFRPVKCFGVIKIIENDKRKKTDGMYKNREGYFRRYGKWIRDDYAACDKAFGENMDWFEADEKEARRAIKELDDGYNRRQEMRKRHRPWKGGEY